MENKADKRSHLPEHDRQPGDMNSFNQRDERKSTGAEDAVKKDKDEGEAYMDYNGNSEANAPARAREEEQGTTGKEERVQQKGE